MTDRTIDWVFRATDRTGAAFRSIDAKLAGITKSLRTFAGFAGFATVAAGIGTLTRDLIQMGGELQDASDKLGVSAEALQSLKFAAEQTGASFDSLQTALIFNAKLTTAAVQGNKAATEAFRELGIDAKKFADIPLDRRLAVIADQLAGIQNPGDRAALAVKALGRGAADLLPLLSQGSDGLAKFDRAARASNAVLSNEQVKALDDAGDAWDAFILRLKVSAAPALTGTISLLNKLAATARDSANATGLLFGEETERLLRSAQGRDRGPSTRGSRRGQATLNEEETAAIIGVPGKKSTAVALAAFQKAFDEVDRLVAAGTAAQREALAERQRIQSEIDQITESTRTPQEAYFAGLDRVAELQRTAGLSAEVASRQILALGEAYATAQQQQYAGTETGRAYLQAIEDAEAIIASVITPFEAYGTQLERINELTAEGLLTQEQSSRAVKLAGQEYADAQIAISKGNNELSDSTERLLKDIKTAADGFARDLTDVFFDATGDIGDMFKDLAETIAKALFTQAVTEPLINSILGSFGGSGLGSLFGGSNAAGGPISGGKAYVVGERGPELFVPGPGGGQVIAGGGGATPVQVNLTITSVDPTTAAQTIAAQERLITGMIRKATLRAGRRPALA